MSTAKTFEALVLKLLNLSGISTQAASGPNDHGLDAIAIVDQERWGVQVKYYRTAKSQNSLLESAGRVLAHTVQMQSLDNGMLVVASHLEPSERLALEARLGLVIVDRLDLLNWIADRPELSDEMRAVLASEDPLSPAQGARSVSEAINAGRTLPGVSAQLPDDRGAELSNQLRGLECGQTTWRQYEQLSVQILKHLFHLDLAGWREQNETADELNRFDVVCRIIPRTEFWRFLVTHLNSRYVLFECKNYCDPIAQGEVLTTEKYLLASALRRVAIVLSRHGSSKSAQAMCGGAIREAGKLILVLSDNDVHQMLAMKDRGDDPSDLLFEKADDFLLSLPR